MLYPGFATFTGNSRYRDRFSSFCAKNHFLEIRKYWLSFIGLGTELSYFAQRALQFTRSMPGLATALIGMKQSGHVEQNLKLCNQPLLQSEQIQPLFKKINPGKA